MGELGMAQAASRELDAPTMPSVESSFARLTPRHAGHAGVLSAVTNVSKWRPQSLHAYSKSGTGGFYRGSWFVVRGSWFGGRGSGVVARSWLRIWR